MIVAAMTIETEFVRRYKALCNKNINIYIYKKGTMPKLYSFDLLTLQTPYFEMMDQDFLNKFI